MGKNTERREEKKKSFLLRKAIGIELIFSMLVDKLFAAVNQRKLC
jgi:hypothetical protein